MTDQQITALINALRLTNNITSLQNDILDTWNELQKNPFDTGSAHKQIISNNISHPDVYLALSAKPGMIQKSGDSLTQDDMIFTLRHQLDGLVAKEIEKYKSTVL